ncbi:ABC transporter ATP-binding protein [Nonlabens xiamenensis]|uniref:ABC transporter ATP-binding protein n=1 Tax=Nonlabens xiamenensis TaxID=2341043 RepID=UPI000F6126DD|nr:ABC transporter ATP-binding protein [Nonlabens xiamenensis]
MIEATHINKSFGDLQVLNDVNLHIQPGEVVSVVGSSGAGKTTLLHILGTLETPDSRPETRLSINGTDLMSLKPKALSRFRNESLGFVFQFHQLLPEFSALENVCLPAYIGNKDKSSTEKRAKELLDYLKLSDRFEHKPGALSGGEQQRVAVARALINNPKVIFADEPTGNLDSSTAEDLHQLIFKLRDEMQQTFVIVTHNEELAELADRKLIMSDGSFL